VVSEILQRAQDLSRFLDAVRVGPERIDFTGLTTTQVQRAGELPCPW